jgi:hypothetical protein
MSRLQHSSDRCARHRAATEDNAGPRTGALHALQGLLAGPWLSLQAEPSGGAAAYQDFGERSAINVVAGRAINKNNSERKMALSKLEIEEQQKKEWLNEHLPYELMMARHSIAQLRQHSTFWLDWNAFLSSFAVSACNLAAFLTNGEKKGNNFQAHDFIEGFRSRKETLAKVFEKLEPQVFHLGKARPTDAGKFTLQEAEAIQSWIEREMGQFVKQLGSWRKHWNEQRATPEDRPVGPVLRITGLEPQTASSADPIRVTFDPSRLDD